MNWIELHDVENTLLNLTSLGFAPATPTTYTVSMGHMFHILTLTIHGTKATFSYRHEDLIVLDQTRIREALMKHAIPIEKPFL